MPTLARLSHRHAHCNWVLVYTLEAHACDEWPISSARFDPSGAPVHIAQHRSLSDRTRAAEDFRGIFQVPFPVVSDTMQNTFEATFCTWPFRFYVLHRRKVVFQAQPQECTYCLEPLVAVLENLQSAEQR